MPKRVLVIDAIATHRICFAALLETARYQVETVATLDDPFRQPSDYDFVLVGLPKEQAGSFVSEVKAALEGSYAPILCLDRYPSMHRRLLVLRAGARDILPVDSPDELILAIVRRLIRQSEADHESQRRRITAASFGFSEAIAKDAKPARIACLGALGNVPSSLSTLLNHEFIQLHSLEDIQDAVGIQGVDGFLLDTGEERQALREILPELRDQTHLSPTPVMAVYPTGIPALATDALALGATEIVADVACIEELELRVLRMLERKSQADALRRSDEQSYRMAATDPLTGLYNRRYAEAYLSSLQVNADEHPSAFSLILVDLDHFKSINDTWGHAAGDVVLCEVARCIQDNLRACDLVARFGGEEFLVVLPETTRATALLLAERLRRAVGKRPVRVPDVGDVPVTASMGVATGCVGTKVMNAQPSIYNAGSRLGPDEFQSVFDAADTALYRAKSTGRDRVVVSAA